MRGIFACQASRMPLIKLFGPPSSSTCGRNVCPRVSTLRFCRMMASNNDAISSSGGVPTFCRPLISVSANTPHLPATLCSLIPLYPCRASSAVGIFSLALILSMTAPVPPAHFIIFENNDFCVLPAQLNDRVNLGMHLLHGQRNCRHFLHELRTNLLGDPAPARAGHEHARVAAAHANFSFNPLQEFQRLFRLLGLMPLVVLPQHLVRGCVNHHGLHRG